MAAICVISGHDLRGTPNMMPWTDRTGRISHLKIVVLAAIGLPALWIAGNFAVGTLGPLPFDAAITETGKWAIRFLLLSLLVTPLHRIGNWPRLTIVRRMIGLAALAYALLHLCLYVADQSFNFSHVFREIAGRIYLTIGFLALTGLVLLGATSSDAMIRRMGRRWKQLHRIVYGLAVLAIVHFFLQTKIDATEATLMAGLFTLLMGYRIALARRFRLSSRLQIMIALVSALVTATLEPAWYGLTTGVDPLAVLWANLAFPVTIRPAPMVFAAGLLVMAMGEAAALIRQTTRAAPAFASPGPAE